MKISVIDMYSTGHHLEYIYGICVYFNQYHPDTSLKIYCSHKIYAYIKENDLKDIEDFDNIELDTESLVTPKGSSLQIFRKAYNNLKEIAYHDHLVFLDLDYYLLSLYFYSLFNQTSFSFSGIIFNPTSDNGLKNFLKRKAWKRILKFYTCTIYQLNNSEKVNVYNNYFNTIKFKSIVDPIPAHYYGNDFSVDEEKVYCSYTFSMIGMITARKGIFQFLDAIERGNNDNSYLIAGKVNSAICDEVEQRVQDLEKKGISICLENRFLTNREFAVRIRKSDIIVLPYLSSELSSGLLGHACVNGKPVVGNDDTLIGKTIEAYRLGITLPIDDTDAFANVLNQRDQIYNIYDSVLAGKYVEHNSIVSFGETLFKEIA